MKKQPTIVDEYAIGKGFIFKVPVDGIYAITAKINWKNNDWVKCQTVLDYVQRLSIKDVQRIGFNITLLDGVKNLKDLDRAEVKFKRKIK